MNVTSTLQATPLHACHVEAGARMVPFGGWDMPLHYGSQLKEHHTVRTAAGVFDVSHMTVVDVTGVDAPAYLRHLLANNIDRLAPLQGLYTCMLNAAGGVVDDLIAFKLTPTHYRLVVNAATRAKDLAWLQQQLAHYKVNVHHQDQVAMLAVQGPAVAARIPDIFPTAMQENIAALKPFHATHHADWFVSRTGYTGEEGFEIILPAEQAPDFWRKLQAADIAPCGLGARDTLRLEAGLNLYGQDMDETVTPLEANLSWTVAFNPADRDFVGRAALEKLKQTGVSHKLVGLVLQGTGVLRHGQKVVTSAGVGEITSGGFSPTLSIGIALARIPSAVIEKCEVEVRGKLLPVHIIKPPFVRHGKKQF